ncbi:DUF1684 domain-containing protein [Cellulomonas cellasea]|uniref:DUF1684 domain-containing protein n=2 Tax=Cellulomonas cellasea TaxID=43670 RepID=A0A0A0B5E6_9CELL|nr:DUF1684 domain-containing protein [Cellulomonas cellasea]KGM01029.1 hypothetical protein Q760_04400 [Cellulomonas cellasea DSM 20118]GEA89232.1 hypothetical protein CCE01nite_31810 [Cellulomonas cellasea]
MTSTTTRPGTTTGTPPDPDDPRPGAPLAWTRWRAERERALAEPHGWLTPVALRWLASRPSAVEGVPGTWWTDPAGHVHLLAQRADGLVLTGAADALDGTADFAVQEGGSQVVARFRPAGRAADDPRGEPAEVAVELVRRTGRDALRLRDAWAPARLGFDGVATFPYDASWILDAPVRWYDEPQPVTVGAAQPRLVHHVTLVGEVDLVRGGTVTTLRLTGAPGGTDATLLLTDEAPGTAPWRVLHVERPADAATTVRLDLNRLLNLPFAFSDHGTCPAPVAGNHVPYAVEVGERAPHRVVAGAVGAAHAEAAR